MQVAAQKVNAIRGLGVQDAQRDKQSSTNGVAGVELRIGHDKNDEGADENLNADDECSRSPGDGPQRPPAYRLPRGVPGGGGRRLVPDGTHRPPLTCLKYSSRQAHQRFTRSPLGFKLYWTGARSTSFCANFSDGFTDGTGGEWDAELGDVSASGGGRCGWNGR